eukprot:scaffold3353_cov144-Skeletonema_menzelii.AAC.9
MATIIYNEDADGNIAQASQEIFPSEELATTSLPDFCILRLCRSCCYYTPNNKWIQQKTSCKNGNCTTCPNRNSILRSDGGPSNASAPESSTSTNEAIDVEPRKPPPPKIAELKTSAPTKAKVTKQPATKAPKPAPITTAYPTDQGTSRVSTETTGPPTVADRDETRY